MQSFAIQDIFDFNSRPLFTSILSKKNLNHMFNPELNWNQSYWQKWHHDNWSLCLYLALCYVFAVRFGLFYMKERKPYSLRIPLAIWSTFLAIFSIIGSYYLVPTLILLLKRDGFHSAVCDNKFAQNSMVAYWSWLFVWSKIVEFGDTAFIVLRKQKLLFLHWYHHALTVICVFTYFPGMVAINIWTGSMNYLVHSFMYSYYALRAIGVKMPKFIAITITTLQIAQMIIGLFVAFYELAMKLRNTSCEITLPQAIFSFSVYSSYFVLFVNFFIRSYFQKLSSSSKNNQPSITNHNTKSPLKVD